MPSPEGLVAIAARLPRHHVERNFLAANDHAALLADTLAHEADYTPSRIATYTSGASAPGQVDESVRRSGRRKLAPEFSQLFAQGIAERKRMISEKIGVPFPVPRGYEIEAVHNGDGAFFSAHIDTTGGAQAMFRVISAVYYYHQSPRRFSGGELKLYSLDRSASVVIEPEDNMMVFFPSIFLHEVLPVEVASRAFEAGRFSVNCWILRAKDDLPPGGLAPHA